MGNTLSAPSLVSTQQDLPTLLLDIPQYLHHGVLGGGKIFKTVQALHEDGFVVLKLYVRREKDFDLKRYELKLEELLTKLPLSATPSILNLIKIDITDRCVYLGRQYLGSNLVDRFHVHPSLHLIEKQWFTFQMLHALQQLHARGIRHGDIKTENFLLTSWNWLFLVDIAFYKPTFLPNDNPADYHFFFENQGSLGSNGMITQNARRRCYLAPERFYSQITDRKFQEPTAAGGSGGSDGQVSEAMDVFSLGCVIAELFLNGEQLLFDLPLLLAYREGEYDPTPVINKIPHPEVRALILHMIQREPSRRYSAKQYLKMWSHAIGTPGGPTFDLITPLPNASSTPASPNPAAIPSSSTSSTSAYGPNLLGGSAPSPLFPPYFGYFYRFFAKLLNPELADPDIKVQALKTHRDTIVREVLGSVYLEQQRKLALANNPAAEGQTIVAPIATTAQQQSHSIVPASKISTAKGAQLLDELSQFQSSLASKTGGGLKPLEELQAQAQAALAAAESQQSNSRTSSSKQANLIPGGAPSATAVAAASSLLRVPTASPSLSPSATPSAATLLDLASASNPQASSTPLQTAAAASSEGVPDMSLDDAVALYHGNGLTLISSLVCSCLQNVRYPITKLTALELLSEFGSYVDDEVRLGRLVPYAVSLLNDPSSMVRATACHIITKLLSQVNTLTNASDAHFMAEYIFPSLSRFPNDGEEIVRLAYAQCIAELASTSKRFLDLAHYAKQVNSRQAASVPGGVNPGTAGGEQAIAALPKDGDGSRASSPTVTPFDGSYPSELSSLQDTVLKLIIDMLTLGGSKVKRALLADITKLCVLMGRKRVNNELLPHLITVLNDRDWQLRSAFFEYIVGVSVFVGRIAFQNFVLPCIEQALFDVEEFVIERALHALTALSQVGLFDKKTAIEVAEKVAPLLCHPSAWIRAETVKFIASLSSSLGLAKSHAFLMPILKPFLLRPASSATTISSLVPVASTPSPIFELSVENVMQHLKPHLTRDEFRLAVAPVPKGTSTSTTTPAKPLTGAAAFYAAAATASPQPAANSNAVPESYAVPVKLIEAGSSWADSTSTQPALTTPAKGATRPVSSTLHGDMTPSVTRISEREDSMSKSDVGLDEDDSARKSTAIAPPQGSGYRSDPALFAVMSTYLSRVSQVMQAKQQQTPAAAAAAVASAAASASAAAASSNGITGGGDLLNSSRFDSLAMARSQSQVGGLAMDEDSLLIELQNMSLSQSLEEQVPLHQIEIEPTVPELGVAVTAALNNAQQLDRAAQETFDSLGINPSAAAAAGAGGAGASPAGAKGAVGSNRPGLPIAAGPGGLPTAGPVDPSVIPAHAGAYSKPGSLGSAQASLATAGATAQGGHPIALREPLQSVPEYVKRALDVPLAPPALGNLRQEWVSHAAFYKNHHVLSPEFYPQADASEPKLWRPKGVLVATLTEHRHVRTLAVSRDNLFLASGGDEGVVKIWDSQRLKLTAHARSQLSYVQHGRITSLCVCDSSHSVASASSNGSLHVFKVEYAGSNNDNQNAGDSNAAPSSSTQRYIGLSDVKRIDPDLTSGEGSILKVDHFNTLSESLLAYATQKAVHGWDLRSKKESFELKLEPSMGLITSMDIGPSPYALVTGSSRGFLTVWDLRFQIPVQVWRHSAKTALTHISAVDATTVLPRDDSGSDPFNHPTKGPLVFAAAEGTNQLAAFDCYTGESRMLFRVINPTGSVGFSAAPGATPVAGASGGQIQSPSTPAGRKASLLGGPNSSPLQGGNAGPSAGGASASNAYVSQPSRSRQKIRVSPLSLPSLRSYMRSEMTTGGSTASGSSAGNNSSSSGSMNMSSAPGFHATGLYQNLVGVTLDDSFLREFQAMGSVEGSNSNGSVAPPGGNSSSVSQVQHSISSLLVCKESFALTAGTDRKVRFWDLRDPADSYRVSGDDLNEGDYLRYNARIENSTVVIEELLSNTNIQTALGGATGGNTPGGAAAGERLSEAEKLRIKAALSRKNQGQVAPSTAHTSEILDMKAFEFPQKMLATASRDGVIKLWI